MALGSSLARVMPKTPLDVSRAYRRENYVDQRVRTDAHAILNHQLYRLRNVERSPAAPAASPAESPAERKAVAPTSDKAVATIPNTAPACMKALMTLNGTASNPSGLAVCYNVMQIDNTTGIFMADVKLYKIAEPTGDWATLDMKKISTSLRYLGATVSQEKPSTTKRDATQVAGEEAEELAKRAAATPESILNTTFIGKAHADVLPHLNNAYVPIPAFTSRTLADLSCRTFQQALLTPNITLAGGIANGSTLHTQLSSDDASFVSGLFQDSMSGNTTAAARAAAASHLAAANAKFVLPGTTLGIFPIGLIITSAWAGIFISVLAYGTFGRIQFRESYRRRLKRSVAGGIRTI